MSVYIPGMKMPSGCEGCYFLLDCGICCMLMAANCKHKAVGEYRWEKNERHPDCPLVPVPDHGRLVDADALDIYRREEQAWHDYELSPDDEYLEGVKDGLHEAAKQLSVAPTVIPAKEGEG